MLLRYNLTRHLLFIPSNTGAIKYVGKPYAESWQIILLFLLPKLFSACKYYFYRREL